MSGLPRSVGRESQNNGSPRSVRAGTSGRHPKCNPLAMAAGIASLKMLKEESPYRDLEQTGLELANGMKQIAYEKGVPLQVPQTGSMFCLFFSESTVTNFEQAVECTHGSFNTVFHKMMEQGVYLPLLHMKPALSARSIKQKR